MASPKRRKAIKRIKLRKLREKRSENAAPVAPAASTPVPEPALEAAEPAVVEETPRPSRRRRTKAAASTESDES